MIRVISDTSPKQFEFRANYLKRKGWVMITPVRVTKIKGIQHFESDFKMVRGNNK